jgi:hypothetical protein
MRRGFRVDERSIEHLSTTPTAIARTSGVFQFEIPQAIPLRGLLDLWPMHTDAPPQLLYLER